MVLLYSWFLKAILQKMTVNLIVAANLQIFYLKENLELDSAPIMNRVSQNFLDRQEKSFNASAMSEQVFCAKTTQKDVKIN